MFQNFEIPTDKKQMYEEMITNAKHLLSVCDNKLANQCNLAALLNYYLKDINWVGFYFSYDNMLILGPFQGLPACTHIPYGRGVCGTAAATKETQLVKDVPAFPGHIACDGASNSEIVVPLIKNGQVLGVLDIDSPLLERFDELDKDGLEALISEIIDFI